MKYSIQGIEVQETDQFEINGATYPSGWLSLSSLEEKAALGILPIIEVYPTIHSFQSYGTYTDVVSSNQITRTYSVVDRDIAEVRGILWERIKVERDRRVQDGGYLVNGHWFHSDTFSRTQQLGLVLLGASIPAGLQWKTMDNGLVDMTPSLAQAIFAAAAASDVAVFNVATAHKAAIDASSTPWTHDYTVGWPVNFQG